MMERRNGRAHGEVFTEINVIQYILNEVGFSSDSDLRNTTILEPSCGHGSFAVEILKRLHHSSQIHHFSFSDALRRNVRFIEINPSSLVELKEKLSATVQLLGVEERQVIDTICSAEDFLNIAIEKKYDCIVGNPPYIRHELISPEDKINYKAKFGTFKNRADLYVPFFEHSLHLLAPNGTLTFICSNRWLYNQYGKPLRSLIAKYYSLEKLLNIEKACPFDEAVIAYPCITTIKNAVNTGKVSYYETASKEINFSHLNFREIESPKTDSWQNLFLHYDINQDGLSGIEQQGFKIGIGVATGADSIFLVKGDDIKSIEKSRLLPIITSRDLSKNIFNWSGQYVINPYEDGHLCDLEKYPNLKVYLMQHRAALQNRHIAKSNSAKWYQTIDKITPSIQNQAKILLPDMTGNKVIFIDEGNFYPHHNLYYITGGEMKSLKVLACLLMSDFVKDQLAQIGIKMNGGIPRFQAQVLKKIKIPDIKLIDAKAKEKLVIAYEAFDFDTINLIVSQFCTKQKINDQNVNIEPQKKTALELHLF